MRTLAPEITCRNKPIGAELLLHAEVPLRDHRVLRVVIHGGHDRIEGPWCALVPVLSKRGREWFSTGIVRPRIVEVHAVDDLALARRRRVAQPTWKNDDG